MSNYIASICIKYGTCVYEDVLRGNTNFQLINTMIATYNYR